VNMVRRAFDALPNELDFPTFQLGKDKAQYLAACFLILPV